MIEISTSETEALARQFSWFRDFGEPWPTGLASLDHPDAQALHFVEGRRSKNPPPLPEGVCLLLPPGCPPPDGCRVAEAARPRAEFARVTQLIRRLRDDSARISRSRDGVLIADDVVIPESSRIEPGAVIGPDVVLGESCVIMTAAVLRSGVRLGTGCRIHPGALVGVDGFGYGWEVNGEGVQIAHLGGVEIGAHVDVGPGSIICAGTIDPTRIGPATKLDGHVYLGHNTQIFHGVTVCAGAVIGGSAEVAEGAWINPGAQIKTKVVIGKGAVIGVGAVVMKSVDPGTSVMGDTACEVRGRLRRNVAIDALLTARRKGDAPTNG